ncbi:hypothetical protein FC40_GL000041 [Ligilactobacillus hayakitensis DSM 18933 = JCM 14209]|uniref:AP2-like integrase N-terminal domain-containing protein n=1 Tax=Ligilactobacillus hayakitensis DSM 18933 = JCM 14209 TaxID=1423755 RepID=A0A0R1WNN7_9LACO|nr:Arm DNA-binding domain-containing protein [Ligilactobacillus hayakitensis]KRM19495.1 hypothetical protein FC40_GL000041 [Ligilactobacillus hayakitensis DSM 18933 = JCM 14209]
MESITKSHGAYRARIDWYDDDGKRHFKSKSGFKTKADVPFAYYFSEWFSIYEETLEKLDIKKSDNFMNYRFLCQQGQTNQLPDHTSF